MEHQQQQRRDSNRNSKHQSLTAWPIEGKVMADYLIIPPRPTETETYDDDDDDEDEDEDVLTNFKRFTIGATVVAVGNPKGKDNTQRSCNKDDDNNDDNKGGSGGRRWNGGISN